MNEKEARERVIRHIREGTSLKLMKSDPRAGLLPFEKARSLARMHPGLSMWSALTAYRMAHLHLRGTVERGDLEVALALFEEAGREPLLGPWPWVYRLPLLHRLERHREQIEDAFLEAVRQLNQWRGRRVRDRQDNDLQGPMHQNVLNLLELSCHFLGLDYSELQGRWRDHEVLFEDLHPNEPPWTVVEAGRARASLALPRSLALAEFEARVATLPAEGFAFELGITGRARVRAPGGPWGREGRVQALHVLTRILKGGYSTWLGIAGRRAEDRVDVAVRQLRRRWGLFVERFSLTDCFEHVNDPERLPEVRPGASILGLVNMSLWKAGTTLIGER